MTVSVKTLGIDRLNIDECLAPVDEIRADICADAKSFSLSAARREELNCRMADDDTLPGDVIPRNEGKASVRVRLAERIRVKTSERI
jgi:hypothetical protein